MRSSTLAIHAGAPEAKLGGPTSLPLVASSAFHGRYGGVAFGGAGAGDEAPDFYTRWGNPTLRALEQRWATLEGASSAIVFSSGMAAISAVFHSALSSGDHVVLSDICYAGVPDLLQSLHERFGINFTSVDATSVDAISRAMTDRTKLVHIEIPSNPLWGIPDLGETVRVAHAGGAQVSVDATCATPIAVQPLSYGVDYVSHSLTKYAVGHSDALGGVLASNHDLHAFRDQGVVHNGGVMSPFAAWLILRGIETLPIRMEVHERNARIVAEFLETHPRVQRVMWPGLKSHPQHERARAQMRNFSGMISFTVEDSARIATEAAERLEILTYAVSLGATKSLIFYIETDTILRFFRLDDEGANRYRQIVPHGLFRLSVGLEDPQDVVADLRRLLD